MLRKYSSAPPKQTQTGITIHQTHINIIDLHVVNVYVSLHDLRVMPNWNKLIDAAVYKEFSTST